MTAEQVSNTIPDPVRPSGDRHRGPVPATTGPDRFRIAVSRALGTAVVTVHGDLDGAGARLVAVVLDDLIDGQGNLAVVVDLHDARAPDASAVAVFTTAAEQAGRRGGALSLSDPPDLLHQELQLRGLGHLLRTTGHRNHPPSPSTPFGRVTAPTQWPSGPAGVALIANHPEGSTT
ncbi:MAG: STAS domain-containing protein [Acidimicrobiales bacterium]